MMLVLKILFVFQISMQMQYIIMFAFVNGY